MGPREPIPPVYSSRACLVPGTSMVRRAVAHKGELLGVLPELGNQEKAYQKYKGGGLKGVLLLSVTPELWNS